MALATQSTKIKRVKPSPVPEWKGKKLEAYLTRKMGDRRVLIKKKKVSARKQTFSWKGSLYYIDPEQIFLFAKRPMLLYDMDYSEPLSERNPTSVTKAEIPELEAHFSNSLEILVQGKALRQVLVSIKDKAEGFNWMVLIWLGLGIALGYFMGMAMPFAVSAVPSVVPKT